VVVERVLKLFRECLDLQPLGEELLLQVVDLFPEVSDLRGLALDDPELALQVGDLELEQADVLEALLVLHLALGKRRLQNLNLLIEKRQLVVASNQLGAQDVTLVYHVLVVLLQLLVLFMRLLDNEG
jgi:hypothetical protein